MPLPPGAHYVNSQRKKDGVRLKDGSVVTRQQAENLGAQFMGFRNDRDYRNRHHEMDRYVDRAMNSKHGKAMLAKYKRAAKARNQPFSVAEYRKAIIALRNSPRDEGGTPIDKSPSSPLANFHAMTGAVTKEEWAEY